MPKLTLYYKPTCPYCQKVLHFLSTHAITVSFKNILEDDYRQELIGIGGKQQVPCLVIDGQALYESDDIIQWFKNNKT